MSELADDIPLDAPPTKGGSKIMPLILVANTLMIAGVLIFVMKRPAAPGAGPDKEHGSAAGERSERSEHAEKSDKGEKSEHGDKAGKSEGHQGEGEGEGEGPGVIMKLDSFVVQIRSIEGDRYAHLTLEMELNGETDKKAFESRMPRVRDLVIGYMSDRTEDELRGSEGLGQVKEALLKKLDETVGGHRIRGLFITEFIIQ